MEYQLQFKSASVCGIGVSNRPLIDFLCRHGVRVTARDRKDRAALEPLATELEAKGVRVICGEDYLRGIDDAYIFRAPGIRYDKPELVEAVERGTVLTSEMELFFSLTPTRIIGVTGSDGKTTTTTLIAKMLMHAGYRVHLGGNIGRPLLPDVEQMEPEDIAVVELSSFQLHTMKQSPDIAVVTNVSPNHLDYHKSMEEYIHAKENIYLHPKNRRLILNYRNEITRAMAQTARPDTEIVFFNRAGEIELCHDAIYDHGERVLSSQDILLPGVHNRENYMAAIGAVRALVGDEAINAVAKTFPGVAHRCELVCERNGVRYYNSSIDSSPTRTIAALSNFAQPLIVICGGYDKHIPFTPLAEPLCEHCRVIVLTGATGPRIRAELDHYLEEHRVEHPLIVEAPEFDAAVDAAHRYAQPGDIVLLSPACASFDAFPNFEARGERFRALVMAIKDGT